MFITTLVLLFIFKLRFPVGTPVTTLLFRRYGRNTLNAFRRKERTLRKLEHSKCDLEFLLKCKSYDILPKFLYFKLYRKNLCNSKLYRSWQFKLLNLEIKSKRHSIRKFSNILNNTLILYIVFLYSLRMEYVVLKASLIKLKRGCI